MAGSRTVQNFVALFGAQAFGMATGLISTAWLARALQPEAFGIVGFGAALLSYVSILVVFGTDRVGMRDIAREPGSLRTVVSRIVGLRFVLLALGAAIFLGVVEAIDQPDRVKNVMRLQTLGLVAAAASLDFVYQAIQRMRIIGLRQAASSLLVLVATLLLIRTPDDLYIAAVIPHAALICTAIWMGWRLASDTGGFGVAVEPGEWLRITRMSAPLAVTAATTTVYLTADILMLGFFETAHVVGLYVGAVRVYTIAGIVAGLLVTVFLPSLTSLFGDRARMASEYGAFARSMIFVGLPIVAVGGCFAGPVIAILLGAAFAEAETALVVLMLASGINMVNQIGCAALISWNGETRQMYLQGGGAVLNVLLNLILIPMFGMVGAAAASVLSELAVAILLIGTCLARYGVSPLRPLAGLGLCAVVAFGGVLALNAASSALEFSSPVLTLIVGASVACLGYALLALATRQIDPARLRAAVARRT